MSDAFTIISDLRARILELEAQLRGTWQPVEVGFNEDFGSVNVTRDSESELSMSGTRYDGHIVTLPGNIRLCRKANKWLPIPPLPLDDEDRKWAIDTARAMGMDEE